MGGADLEARLQTVVKKYYAEPLQSASAVNEQLLSIKKDFLERFFVSNGSLASLKELVSDKSELYSDLMLYSKNYQGVIYFEDRLPDKSKLRDFNQGKYLEYRNNTENAIRNVCANLIGKLCENLTDHSTQVCIEETEQALNSAKSSKKSKHNTLCFF